MHRRRHKNVEIFEDTQKRLKNDVTTHHAIAATQTYEQLPLSVPGTAVPKECTLYHWLATTLEASRMMRTILPPQEEITVLNFASGRHPGGGVERGAGAQEESLCRATALFSCLKPQTLMYERNNANADGGLYQPLGIYSPRVPVIKDDGGAILSDVYTINIISIPAVNAGEALKHQHTPEHIRATMQDRIDNVLSVAAHHHQQHLILGAFGCGVFKNSVYDVARMFKHLLTTKYKGYFSTVVFATISQEEHDILKYYINFK